jgi:hypothetical protein
MCQQHMDLINAMDEAVATILRLSELGPAIDSNPELFPNCIELLSLIAREAGHLEKLSTQLSHRILPSPHVIGEDAR